VTYIPMSDMFDMVCEFHNKMGIEHDLEIEDQASIDLRLRLILEEYKELVGAVGGQDRPANRQAVADALGDILYVVLGAADIWCIDIDRVFAEIHRSNMTKEPGHKRADGKIMKGPNYSPPDLSFVGE